jgi:hypothetical protein
MERPSSTTPATARATERTSSSTRPATSSGFQISTTSRTRSTGACSATPEAGT